MVKLVVLLIWVYASRAEDITNVLGLFEGDVCKEGDYGEVWTCKHHRDCPRLTDDVKEGNRPPICSFIDKDPVVCCESPIGEKPTLATGVTSKQMCLKYAESVFIELPDIGEGKSLFDTCSKEETTLFEKDASPREFPHTALVGFGEEWSIEWLCGGSLISDRYVLSSARCSNTTKGAPKWVRLGEYNRNSLTDEEQGRSNSSDYKIVEIIDHPDFKKGSAYYDIALYKLNTTVTFSEFTRPICLQTEHQFPKTHVITAGWGQTDKGSKGNDIIHKSNLTIIPIEECNQAYKDIIGKKIKDGIRNDSMLCAVEEISKKNNCEVDLGGPLQVPLKNPHCMYSLVGIYSFGAACGGDRPGVFTRVSYFVPWIERIVWAKNTSLTRSYYLSLPNTLAT